MKESFRVNFQKNNMAVCSRQPLFQVGSLVRAGGVSGKMGQPAMSDFRRGRFPICLPTADLRFAQFDIEATGGNIDVDEVSISKDSDGTPDHGLRGEVADTRSSRASGKSAIGHQGY